MSTPLPTKGYAPFDLHWRRECDIWKKGLPLDGVGSLRSWP